MRLMRRKYDLGRCSSFEMNGLSKGRTFSPVFPLDCPFPCSVLVDSSFAYIVFHTGFMRDSSRCAKWPNASHSKHYEFSALNLSEVLVMIYWPSDFWADALRNGGCSKLSELWTVCFLELHSSSQISRRMRRAAPLTRS